MRKGMEAKLIAHTQLSEEFRREVEDEFVNSHWKSTHGQSVALSAIRTCYSANKPSKVLVMEGDRYFGQKATDGAGGTETDRLIRQIIASKHTSTVEHLSFTFSIEGVSRSLLAQLTRHRVGFSYSVQSQRYVRFGSNDKSGGFDYVVPDKIAADEDALANFENYMEFTQHFYDELRANGIPAEDARSILPQAATTNLVMTANLRALLDFYSKRRKGNGAQSEIAELAELLKDEVIKVEPWTKDFFEKVGKQND